MKRQLSFRFRVEALLAVVSAVLTALTFVWPQWIEGLFGFSPDEGTGETEWLVAVGFLVVTIAIALVARREWRRSVPAVDR